MSHIYINNPELPEGFHYRYTVDLTEPTYSDDTFQVLRSDEPHYPMPFNPFFKCWTWTAWRKGKAIVSILGDEDKMPKDILQRAKQICYGEIELPLPKSVTEDSFVVDYESNSIITTQEYKARASKQNSLNNLRRGNNPGLNQN